MLELSTNLIYVLTYDALKEFALAVSVTEPEVPLGVIVVPVSYTHLTLPTKA